MTSPRTGPVVAVCLAAMAAAAALSAQTPIPTPKPTPWALGSPESVVSAAGSNSTSPAVDFVANNEFVLAWSTGNGIVARRFDRSGTPLADQFQVSTSTGVHSAPSVAARGGGSFLAVWSHSPDEAGGSDILGRFFDASGNALGGEFTVNTYTTGNQTDPRADDSILGRTIVVWSSAPASGEIGQDGDGSGVYGQMFAFDGTPHEGEFVVNTYTTGEQRAPSVHADSGGVFVVVWESEGQDGDGPGIFGKSFYSPLSFGTGQEFAVNSQTTGAQTRPDVLYESAFVVAWESEVTPGAPTDIYARQFQGSLHPYGPDFRVNSQTAGAQRSPRVGPDPPAWFFGPGFLNPAFMIVWESEGQDDPGSPTGVGVFAQRFNNAPDPSAQYYLIQPQAHGAEYQVNATTSGDQGSPDVAFAANGQFVIAWRADGPSPGEGQIVTRPFNYPEGGWLTVDTQPSGGPSNLNTVLEAGERVVVAPTWRNRASDVFGFNMTASASNLTGPEGPSYAIDDAQAAYVGIPSPGYGDCFSTGDCYEVTVAGARPQPHWDATFDESPSFFGPPPAPGTVKTWPLHVGGSFPDVPQDSFYPFIESIFHHGVTAGGGCGVGLYCGEESVSRQQMAVLLLKSAFGSRYVPAPPTGDVLADVLPGNPFAAWIEDLFRRGIVAGCDAPPPPALPSYCPTNPVNRQQMAVLLYKMHWGADAPENCAGFFADLPCTNPFAPYAEFIVQQQVAAGCSASPALFCPTDPTKRKQMAALLVKTFGLVLYGPD